ncbi:unnamed protein product [Moneuplotes crassus]|uniref:Uncharacterized protein n=1 Tax=Euplotes crassus TaxID=5936 RepID=A0AAD1US19_EUPCR|nr:unnamed protein product [Moneuplotes crassus]
MCVERCLYALDNCYSSLSAENVNDSLVPGHNRRYLDSNKYMVEKCKKQRDHIRKYVDKGGRKKNTTNKRLDRITLSPKQRPAMRMPPVIAPRIREKGINIIMKTKHRDHKMPDIRALSTDKPDISKPKPLVTKSATAQLQTLTSNDKRRNRLLSNNLNSFKVDSSRLEGVSENHSNRRSLIRERCSSINYSKYSISRLKNRKLDEDELKNIKMERIFKSIQDQTEKGEKLKLTEIGLKGTPYHKLLQEEQSKKHFTKRKDFDDILEKEKRFTDTITKGKRDAKIYQRLAKDLSLDDIEDSYNIPKKIIYDKESCLNPKRPRHRYGNSLSISLMNNVAKLNQTNVQSHLKKLRFANGQYQLSPVDSIKRFNERPLNEVYNGKLLK